MKSTNRLLLLIALLAIAGAACIELLNDRDMASERLREVLEP